jgi:hypothetical protein
MPFRIQGKIAGLGRRSKEPIIKANAPATTIIYLPAPHEVDGALN